MIKTTEGQIVAMRCSAVSSVQVEGWAILSALCRSKMEGWQRMMICLDSKDWINFVNNVNRVPWYLSSLYRDILNLADEAKVISFQHINRTCNGNAHRLANLGRSQGG